MTSVTTVVLAGGQARRMEGVDKVGLRLGGMTLLDRVLAAAETVSTRLLVVGPPRPTEIENVEFLMEPSPGGGPVPAVLTAVSAGDSAGDPGDEVVLVLAADLPFLTPTDLALLIDTLVQNPDCHAAAARGDGPGDGGGKASRPNPLLAAYRRRHLEAIATRGPGPDSPAADLLPVGAIAVALSALATFNLNSPTDLQRASALLDQTTRSSPA